MSIEFRSRRPVAVGQHGAVACADPYAARAGLDVLRAGGNAADAAVAMEAVLNVTLPMSTGIGGDAFCLFYGAQMRQVHAINGSGRSPSALTLESVKAAGYDKDKPLPITHGNCVTVPGAAATWVDLIKKFGSGKLTMKEILQPAISLAEDGYPVGEVAACFWEKGSWQLRQPQNVHGGDMLVDGQAPKWGEIFRNPNLAQTFRELAKGGKKAFYEGRIADAIVEAVKRNGGVMTSQDLKNHVSTFETPINTVYKGVRLWEIPPNTQGIVALEALNILKGFNLKDMGHNSTAYLHHSIEAIRLGFADALAHVSDMAHSSVPVDQMLSQSYADSRRKLIRSDRAMTDVHCGDFRPGNDTVYLTVTDCHGNACSFIDSNYMGFGTGIVPEGCGFTLQNRGWNFSLEDGHPNALAPNKRPYHTIIPAMLTDATTGELLASYGIMGGFMQPQAHVQVLLNMLEFGMNPQQALDQPRFCVGDGHTSALGSVALEEGIPQEVIDGLSALGHHVRGPIKGVQRAIFGRGHVITRGAWWRQDDCIADDKNVWWAGSDPRADGLALAY